MLYGLGTAAFALFFLGDWNDWKWETKPLRACFPAGLALLTAVTVLQSDVFASGTAGVRLAFLAPAAVFFALLVYTLFFALPAADAYVRQEERRPACTRGVYALCRHPGVLWFTGLYLCLVPAVRLPLPAALLYSVCNVLLVLFEDMCVFPARLTGYDAYKRVTPFLLPSRRSLRRCLRPE